MNKTQWKDVLTLGLGTLLFFWAGAGIVVDMGYGHTFGVRTWAPMIGVGAALVSLYYLRRQWANGEGPRGEAKGDGAD